MSPLRPATGHYDAIWQLDVMKAVVMWPTPTLSRARDEKSFDRASVEYSEKLEGQTTLLTVVRIVSKRAKDKIWYGYSSQVRHEGLGSSSEVLFDSKPEVKQTLYATLAGSDLRDINTEVWSVDLIAWWRLAESSRNVAIYNLSDYIVKQTII